MFQYAEVAVKIIPKFVEYTLPVHSQTVEFLVFENRDIYISCKHGYLILIL